LSSDVITKLSERMLAVGTALYLTLYIYSLSCSHQLINSKEYSSTAMSFDFVRMKTFASSLPLLAIELLN